MKKHGELLLSLATNCRKLQTQKEKIVISSDSNSIECFDLKDNEQYFMIQVLDLKSHFDLNDNDLQNMMKLMQNFWKRQAIVEAQIVALNEKKAELIKENQNYIYTIKSLSKTTDVNKLQETLMIHNAKL